MADEKKTGFFKRLFGFGKTEEVAAPVAETIPQTLEITPDADESVKRIAAEIAEAKRQAEQAEDANQRAAQASAEAEQRAAEKAAEAKALAEEKAARLKSEKEARAAEAKLVQEKLAQEKAGAAKAAEAAAKLEAEKLEAKRKAEAEAAAVKDAARKLEAEKIEAAKVEAAKLEAAKLETAKLETAKLEAAKLEAARVEAERLKAAQAFAKEQAAQAQIVAAEKAALAPQVPAPAVPAPVIPAPIVPAPIVPAPVEAPAPKTSWWQKLKSGLSRTASTVSDGITGIFTKRKLDDATLEDLEDILIQADLGIDVAARISAAVGKGSYDKEIEPEEVKKILSEEVAKVLTPVAKPLIIDSSKKPFVLLMIGVNGSGKTTTIGKLASKFRAEGKSVMLAAGDTFRAAAIEQLKVWGQRTGAPVISHDQGGDAAGLAFDALKTAKEAGTDVLLIDTAGRLQNRTELMAELEKVIRVIKKLDETAPHGVLLVLDATVGQNALSQVEIFGKTAGVTGLVMTKLDGTARGGILVAIAEKFKMPVHFIGVGEGIDDLEPFAAQDFARAIAGLEQLGR
jgi:fused signal recognition particle receptor